MPRSRQAHRGLVTSTFQVIFGNFFRKAIFLYSLLHTKNELMLKSSQIYPTRSWHTNGYTQISLLQLQNELLAFLRFAPGQPTQNLTKIRRLLLTSASIISPVRILSLAHVSSSATPLVSASNLHDSRRRLSHSPLTSIPVSMDWPPFRVVSVYLSTAISNSSLSSYLYIY